MCLAVPLRLEEIRQKQGVGEFNGARRTIRLDFVPQAKIGDYVMVHAGFAIERIDEAQAKADREAFLEILNAK